MKRKDVPLKRQVHWLWNLFYVILFLVFLQTQINILNLISGIPIQATAVHRGLRQCSANQP